MPKKLLSFVFALLLTISVFLGLTGCEKNYPTARSSARDRRVMAEVGGYKVRYELIRALFFQNKDMLDGGADSIWTGEQADEYFTRAKELIDSYIREIYGTYLFASSVGIDPESKAINKTVMDMIRTQIEGGNLNNEYFEGYGSRREYLSAIAEMHMTDSVNRLILRWNAVQSVLNEYYKETYANGTVEYNERVLNEYYLSNDCLHFNWVRISKDQPYEASQLRSLAEEARTALLSCTDESRLRQTIALYSVTSASSEIDYGLYITPHSFSPEYDRLIDTIRSTAPHGISEIVETEEAFYIIVGREKQIALPDDSRVINAVSEAYLDNCLYSAMKKYISELEISYNSAYEKLTPADFIG